MPVFGRLQNSTRNGQQSKPQIRNQLDVTRRQIELWFCWVGQESPVFTVADPDEMTARRTHMHASAWRFGSGANDETCGFFRRPLAASPLMIHGQTSSGFGEPADTQAGSESGLGVRRQRCLGSVP